MISFDSVEKIEIGDHSLVCLSVSAVLQYERRKPYLYWKYVVYCYTLVVLFSKWIRKKGPKGTEYGCVRSGFQFWCCSLMTTFRVVDEMM